jgi:hypothetical protein
MFDGGGGQAGVTVFSGQVEFAQTCHYVINQLREVSGTPFIAEMKVVEFRGVFRSCQPIVD